MCLEIILDVDVQTMLMLHLQYIGFTIHIPSQYLLCYNRFLFFTFGTCLARPNTLMMTVCLYLSFQVAWFCNRRKNRSRSFPSKGEMVWKEFPTSAEHGFILLCVLWTVVFYEHSKTVSIN